MESRFKKRNEIPRRLFQRRSRGSAADVLTVCIYVIVLTLVMTAYMESASLLNHKLQIGQIARKYILRMETVGYLRESDQAEILAELREAGAENVDLSGSTVQWVGFGSPVYLVIKGQIPAREIMISGDLLQAVIGIGQFDFEEKRVSTAKN